MDHKIILDEAQEFGFKVDPDFQGEAPFNVISDISAPEQAFPKKQERRPSAFDITGPPMNRAQRRAHNIRHGRKANGDPK